MKSIRKLKESFRSHVFEKYEYRAKSCLTCETPGACCRDAHFVNVHISRLEAIVIGRKLKTFSQEKQRDIYDRIENTINEYSLNTRGDTFALTFACPLFERGVGCLVHGDAKPLACIAHACYENKADLPPDALVADQEEQIDDLNTRTFGSPQPWLPLPVAIVRTGLCVSSIQKQEPGLPGTIRRVDR
jgi:hypothetical protein